MIKNTASKYRIPLIFYVMAFVIVAAAIKIAAPILTSFIVASFVGLLSLPLLTWLQKKRIPSVLAILIIFLVLLLGIVLFLVLFYLSFLQINRFFLEHAAVIAARFNSLITFATNALSSLPSDFKTEIPYDPSMLNERIQGLIQSSGSWVVLLVTRVTDLFSTVGFVVILGLFILAEAMSLRVKFRIIAPKKEGQAANVDHLSDIVRIISRYMLIKILTSAATSAIVGILLSFIGMKVVLPLMLITFFLNFIPTIGSIMAFVPAVLLAWVQFDGYFAIFYIALVYLCVNLVVGMIVEPRVFGDILDLSPLVVLLSLVFWTYLLGAVGAFFCVPLTCIAVMAMQYSHSPLLRKMAIMLGNMSRTNPKMREAMGKLANEKEHTQSEMQPLSSKEKEHATNAH